MIGKSEQPPVDCYWTIWTISPGLNMYYLVAVTRRVGLLFFQNLQAMYLTRKKCGASRHDTQYDPRSPIHRACTTLERRLYGLS